MQETTRPTPQEAPETLQEIVLVGHWYETQEGRLVLIQYWDERLSIFVGQMDARLAYYDAQGQPYYLTGNSVIPAPDTFRLRSLTPVPAPPMREYHLDITISASIRMCGISLREVMALAPDMIDLEALDKDLSIDKFSIKVEGGHR